MKYFLFSGVYRYSHQSWQSFNSVKDGKTEGDAAAKVIQANNQSPYQAFLTYAVEIDQETYERLQNEL